MPSSANTEDRRSALEVNKARKPLQYARSETVHIGEVVEVFNPHTGVVWIHHWIDLTGGISKYNDAKDVTTRKLYPEYDDETGCSYVIKKSSDKLNARGRQGR